MYFLCLFSCSLMTIVCTVLHYIFPSFCLSTFRIIFWFLTIWFLPSTWYIYIFFVYGKSKCITSRMKPNKIKRREKNEEEEEATFLDNSNPFFKISRRMQYFFFCSHIFNYIKHPNKKKHEFLNWFSWKERKLQRKKEKFFFLK